jgi:hypothetical protein
MDQEEEETEVLDSQKIENPFTETNDNMFAEEFNAHRKIDRRSNSSSLRRNDDNFDHLAK